MEKPQNVLIAVNLQWVSIAVGLINGLLGPTGVRGLLDPTGPLHQSSVTLIAFIIIFILTVLGLMVLLTLKISAGKNWARITFLILYLLGLPLLSHLPATFQQSTINGMIFVVQTVLQAAVLFLVFTKPGSEWFSGNNSSVSFEQARQNRLRDQ